MSSSTATQYEALAKQIEALLQNLDGAGADVKDDGTRRRLIEGGRKLAASLEQPRETLRRIGYAHFHLPLALVGVDTGVFGVLAATQHPVSFADLAEKSGVDINLLRRFLRYYQSTNLITQIDDDTYQANNVTRSLSDTDHGNSMRWIREVPAQGSLNLPVWLKSHHYKDPLDVMPTPWTSAIGTDKSPYQWLGANPWALDLAQAHMKVQREHRPIFLDALDFEKRFSQGADNMTVVFVDVGGGTGSQSRALRKRYPNLPGRVVLQDQPEVVEHVKADLAGSGIEAEVYNMFTPQPVRGARAYYMRNIFHAWGNPTCKKILANIKDSMTEESALLIDDIVLPERHASTTGAEHDMEVMVCVGGIERTRAQWESLLDEAGLKIIDLVRYDPDWEDSVIIAGLK